MTGPCREFTELRTAIERLRGGFQANVDSLARSGDSWAEARRRIYVLVVADLDDLLARADTIANPNPEQES